MGFEENIVYSCILSCSLYYYFNEIVLEGTQLILNGNRLILNLSINCVKYLKIEKRDNSNDNSGDSVVKKTLTMTEQQHV